MNVLEQSARSFGVLDAADGSSPRPIRVSHVITTLSTGGAERMLLKLLTAMDAGLFHNSVIGLCREGVIADGLREIGIPVTMLDLRPTQAITGCTRLTGELRKQRPDVVQTWLYHADFLGGLAALPLRGVPVVWNVRSGALRAGIEKRSTICVSRICAAMSRAIPSSIVCCSHTSLQAHAATGYARRKMQVIPNGFDTDVFAPRPAVRDSVRDRLGIDQDSLVVGLVARYHPAKDHATFCAAAGIVATKNPQVRFVLCGNRVTPSNEDLTAALRSAGIEERCHLLGERDDIPEIMAALDIAVLSSAAESFPNVIGEAMACGVPCVSTDAGESRVIVGDTGIVVPTRDPIALASGIQKMIDAGAEHRAELGKRARRRIAEQFAIGSVARRYEQLYRELATRCVA